MASRAQVPGLTPDELNDLPKAPEEEVFEEEVDNPEERLIAVGTWPGKVIDFELGTSKGGDPMYIAEILITAGPSKGKTRKTFMSKKAAARWKCDEFFVAVGLKPDGNPPKYRFTKKQVVGQPVLVTITHAPYNGAPSDNIASVLPPNADAVEAMSTQPDI